MSVDIFEMTSDEMMVLIAEHIDSVEQAIGKCSERIEREESEVMERPHMASFCSTAIDVFKSALKALETRADEARWMYGHLKPGRTLAMSAAHLIGFRAAFGPVVVDVDMAIVAAHEAPKPSAQAERAVKEALVQVPRISLPTGILA